MKRRTMALALAFALALTSGGCISFRVTHAPSAATPSPEHAALRAEVLRADSLMFAAYNAHDAERLMTYFTKDLEFYHDTGGLLSWSQVMEGWRHVFPQSPDIHRELVGEVEVYPIKGYGAVEIGAHRFCHRENGKDDCGTFKFVQTWRKSAEGWQVARAVSYGH